MAVQERPSARFLPAESRNNEQQHSPRSRECDPGLYTAGTVLFTLLSAWFAASGVSQMATEKQMLAEAAV